MTQWSAWTAVAKWLASIVASLLLLGVAASGNYVKDNRDKSIANEMQVELVKQKVASNKDLMETRLKHVDESLDDIKSDIGSIKKMLQNQSE